MDRLTQEHCSVQSSQTPDASARRGWGQDVAEGPRLAERAAPPEEDDDRVAWLTRTIETEIIPRLMLAHQPLRSIPQLAESRIPRPPGGNDILEFADIVLNGTTTQAAAYVDGLRAKGTSLEIIYLGLLAPTAKHLGALWEADRCDFTQVTVGLWRLQQLMYDLSPAFQSEDDLAMHSRRAMLVPAPGAQHTLGLLMVSEFFRRAGWDVWGEPCSTPAQIVQASRTEWFDVAGFSAGTEQQMANLASVILDVRKLSMNPSILVLVGGPIFAANPELVSAVGADATATNAPHAVEQAETLMKQRESRC